MSCLALVCADDALTAALAEQLRASPDWQMAVFSSMTEALSAWSAGLPALVLWDIQTGAHAREAAALAARRADGDGGLLVLIGKDPDLAAQVRADELWERPLRLGWILTQLPLFARRLASAAGRTFQVGGWVFSARDKTLCCAEGGGGSVHLTDKESALLEQLCESQAPQSRAALLAAVWGYDHRIDTHTLETHIYRLRQKLMGEGLAAPLSGAGVFLVGEDGYALNPAWRGGEKT